jgi:hypothetical protein
MNKRESDGISEIIGTILLLLIAVSIFSVVYLTVLNSQEVTENTIVNIVATVEGENIILEHRGGESIDIDTTLSYTLNQTSHSFLVSDFLEEDAKLDNKWNLGERCYIPFEYDIDYLEHYDTVDIASSDVDTNNLVFIGTLDLEPMSDLGIEVSFSPEEPSIGDTVTITIVASCRGGDVGARNVEIRCKLPDGLIYQGYSSTQGPYTNSSGIWRIDKLDIGESETLNVNAEVSLIEKRPFIQLAMVLDGSGSISSSDWETMRTGLANAVSNQDTFPRDESVELTVVQFGGSTYGSGPRAEVDPGLDQKIISDDPGDDGYYDTISSHIRNLNQMEGATPTSCGIRLGTDKIHESSTFDSDNRSILILVTDGKANCEWTSGYEGSWDGNGWVKSISHSHTGSCSAHANRENDGSFISKSIDTTNASTISINFYYRLDDTNYEDDLYVYYFDGTNYDPITTLAHENENVWLYYQDTISDPQYFHSNFNVKFYSRVESGENVWIDDFSIDAGESLFSDGFESLYWNKYWTDPGKISAEEAREYMLTTLDMNESQDEFDCLAVGSGPELYWLNHSMIWPQPGYQAPPFDQGSGWMSHISSYDEFELAINEIFKTIFESRITPVKIERLEPVDPNQFNDDIQISIIPKD